VIFDQRRPRTSTGPLLAGYPPRVRQLIFWYDALTDWQRIQYAAAAILFLLACGGYLLGLGSAMVLQRMDVEAAAMAAQPLPTAEPPTATTEPVVVVAPPTATPRPSATAVPPTARPSATPFNAPQIAEPRAVPRTLPEAPVPAAPVRSTPTPDTTKPRNLETSKPEPPAASVLTPTPGLIRTAQPVPTAVRQATSATRPTTVLPPMPTLPLPTLPLPATTPTAGPAQTRPPVATPIRTATIH
jgi:hypothetical protein